MTARVKIRAWDAERDTNLSLTPSHWTCCASSKTFSCSLAQSPKGCQANGSWQFYSNSAINHPKGALDQPTRGNYLDSWLTTTSQELSFISSQTPRHSCRNANQLLFPFRAQSQWLFQNSVHRWPLVCPDLSRQITTEHYFYSSTKPSLQNRILWYFGQSGKWVNGVEDLEEGGFSAIA